MPVTDGDPIPLAVQSVCVHGDTAGAVEMARVIRERLAAAGVTVGSFLAR
jgi:5-oxoprolinase (ATP-hydrolysing) subunit A